MHSTRNDVKEYVTCFVAGKGAARFFSHWFRPTAAEIPNRQGEGLLIRLPRAPNCAADSFYAAYAGRRLLQFPIG